ncbi:MAG: shikimate dehydrogenase [Chitinophagales bacterium]
MTKLAGVCGWPVAQNLSPYMHNAAFQALGLDWLYLAFPVRPEKIGDALRGLPALGIAGVNLSLPHKIAAVEFLDELSEKARLVGSANTVVVREDGSLYGHNTDGEGCLRALRQELDVEPAGFRIALVGAGGVARSIAASFAMAGAAEIAVFDQDAGRVADVAGLAEKAAKVAGGSCRGRQLDGATLAGAVFEADLVVNATPVGMWPNVDATPVVDPALLHEGQVLYDVIHNPPESRLVGLARARGARALGGLPMLVHQGALAFEAWTGVTPPLDVMKQALREELERRCKA